MEYHQGITKDKHVDKFATRYSVLKNVSQKNLNPISYVHANYSHV